MPAASWLVAGAALAMRSPGRGPAWLAEQISGPGRLAIGPLLFTLAAALFAFAASGQRAALYALCILALADQAIYAATLWWSDPPRTLEEEYQRTLEEEALLQSIEDQAVCPGCERRIREDWIVCPTCQTKLRKQRRLASPRGFEPLFSP